MPGASFNGYLVYIPGRGFTAFTGPDGSFQIDNVPAGVYELAVVSGALSVRIPDITVADTLVTLPEAVQVATCQPPPVCTPTGAEVCDGIDNDCDGVIDEGNPGGGASCSTALPGVCAAGITACSAQGLVCAQTTASTAEICGDFIDNDCDGQVDETCVVLHQLTVTRTGTGSGVVDSSPVGISCGAVCAASFDASTVVTLTAAPIAGSAFSGWSGACSGTAACVVPMDSAKSVIATFSRNSYQLTVTRTGTGSGAVDSYPVGISCGASCAASFDASAVVSLTASPGAGSMFGGWSGACTGTGGCSVTMDAAKNVTATFIVNTYSLTVSRTAGGTVTSDPSGIYCGAACTAVFNAGTSVTLVATPDPGFTFVGWGGGSCSGTSACMVTMNSAKSVTARFTTNLTVTRAGTGSGVVDSNPAGISCGSTCVAAFDGATVVTLTATPSAGSAFSGWSGACSGIGTCNVSMDSAKNVTATFTRNTYQLTVTRSGAGSGVVDSSPVGISCGTVCAASFDAATVVTLTATPSTDSTFFGWSGAGCAGNAICTVTMDAAKTATAIFTLR